MKKQKIDWEKVMVIAVMTAALACIIFLLATNISPTGQGISDLTPVVPTPQVILDVLSSAQEFQGTKTCNSVCLNQKRMCILAVSGAGELYQCDTNSAKKTISCMCAKK